MDTNSSKKQRKNQREGKHSQEAHKQRTTQTINESKPEPQPQRVNRRHKNEVNKDKSSLEIAPPSAKEEKKTEESIIIDHSNLKRETEDIAKLTKKFTRREITSNWHRYSAPETNTEIKNTDEDAPADFSDLLQVPISRGGHLQLKEEQEWSNASHTELNGYFALDLKLLSQSLATIPAHEILQLPKHLLTAEELNHFETLAEQAKHCYNPDKIPEDPNAKVYKVLTSLIQSSTDKGSELTQSTIIKDSNNVESCFNNTDDFEKSQEVLNISLQSNPETINSSKKYVFNSSNQNEKQVVNNETLDKVCTTSVIDPNVIVPKLKCNISLGESLPETLQKEMPQFPSRTINSHNILDNQNIDQLSQGSIRKGEIYVVTLKQDETKLCEPKEKRSSRRGSSKCKENVEDVIYKTSEKVKGINLDDDDDLDFLLSLKNPVTPHVIPKGTVPAPIKESSVLPMSISTSTTTTKSSELDDWLESVLQD